MDHSDQPGSHRGSPAGPASASERTLFSEATGELLRRLVADLAALSALYGREIQAHVRSLGRDVGVAAVLLGAALVLGVFALGVAVAALILIVAIWVPAWLAALVVLGAMIGSMGLLVALGVRRVRRRQAVWAARVAEEIRWLRSLFPREN